MSHDESNCINCGEGIGARLEAAERRDEAARGVDRTSDATALTDEDLDKPENWLRDEALETNVDHFETCKVDYERNACHVRELSKEILRLRRVIRTGGAMYRAERACMGIPGGLDPNDLRTTAERVSAEAKVDPVASVRDWPAWRKAGVNYEQPGIVPDEAEGTPRAEEMNVAGLLDQIATLKAERDDALALLARGVEIFGEEAPPPPKALDEESYTVRRFVLDHCAALGAEYASDFRKDLIRMLDEVRRHERDQRRESDPTPKEPTYKVARARRLESARAWLHRQGVSALLGDANAEALANEMALEWEPSVAGVQLTATVTKVGAEVALTPDDPHHWPHAPGARVLVLWRPEGK